MEHTERHMAQLFKALSDENRIKILEFLRYGERCVCEIVPLLGTTQSNVSQHLRVLRDSNVIDYRKEGKSMYYFITLDNVIEIMDMVEKEVKKE